MKERKYRALTRPVRLLFLLVGLLATEGDAAAPPPNKTAIAGAHHWLGLLVRVRAVGAKEEAMTAVRVKVEKE